MTHKKACRALKCEANPQKALVLQKFFKTGKGEYGEGDLFLGVVVPKIRGLARQFRALSLKDVERLLNTKIHEQRLLALLILVLKFQGSNKTVEKLAIYRCYLRNLRHINNWDLVDLSAGQIVGAHLLGKDTSILYKLAVSKRLWDRRVAMISTFHFIRNGVFDDALGICKCLLKDEEDLIHKAVGWMLREIGKRDLAVEEAFLKAYYRKMPRTMLRYAIERFPENRRLAYLRGKVD